MTLKEKVAEMEPGCLSPLSCGGVLGCPSEYKYLRDGRSTKNCGEEICDAVCTDCWNREFVPKEEEKKMTLKEKVQRVSKLCRDQGECENCPVKQHSEEIGACTTNIFATVSEERLDAMLKCFDGESDKLTEATKTPSAIDHPSHYCQGGVECIDAIKAATVGLNGFEGFCAGNALKYLWRWKHKNGVEDLKKCQWYLDRLIEEQEAQE